MRLAIAATLLALGACAHSAKHESGDEYVKKIKLEGNGKLKSKTLIAGLALERSRKGDRPPDPYLVQVDADRIRGQYIRKGFLAVDVRSRVERDGDATTVIYTVEEGARAKTKVVVNGVPPDDRDLPVTKIRKVIPMKDGDPFDYEKYDLAKEQLVAVVKDAGYARAKLDTTVFADRANHEAVIQLDYRLGPKCKFGTIEITGADGDLARAVRNRVRFKQGEQYSTAKIAATQRALYGMQRFSTVQVAAVDGDGADVHVKVAVIESARHEVKAGAGFGIDPTAYEVRGLAGYTITGWPFDLDTVTLNLRPAYAYLRDGSGYEPRIRAVAKLERQDLFWTYARGELEAGYNYLAVEAYTSYGPRARVGFSTPILSRRVQLRLGWGFEYLDFRNISPLLGMTLEEALGLDKPERIGTFDQAVIVDLRDHPIEPKLGAYGELRVSEGTPVAGSNYTYYQVVPELRGFVPLGRVVLASRARAGAIFGDIPPTERFFAGGSNSHRGFGERKLSPFVSGDDMGTNRIIPYGGGAMIETGVEARVPITTWRKMGIGSVVFLDGGDVTETYRELDPMNLHWALGVGARVLTIVGPIRADFGYRLNRTGPTEPAPDSKYAFHLSLGEAF